MFYFIPENHKEGSRQVRKRKCLGKSAKIENTYKTVRSDNSSWNEFQNSDDTETGNMMTSDNETFTYDCNTPYHHEGVHQDCNSSKEDSEQEDNNKKQSENTLARTKSDNSVRVKAHIKISDGSNIELEPPHMGEIIHDNLLNLQVNGDVNAEENICTEDDRKSNIVNTDTSMNSRSSNYNFRHKRSLDRFKLIQLVNLADIQDKYRCNKCGKVCASKQSLKSHKDKIHSDKTLEKKEVMIKQQKETEIAACSICRKLFADSE